MLSVCPSVDIFDEFSRITGSFLIRFVIINTLLQIQNTNAKDRNIGSYLHYFSDQIFQFNSISLLLKTYIL